MKGIGEVTSYNGDFGEIAKDTGKISFSKRDVSKGQVQVGDIVIYRIEKREPDLTLARHVKVITKTRSKIKPE